MSSFGKPSDDDKTPTARSTRRTASGSTPAATSRWSSSPTARTPACSGSRSTASIAARRTASCCRPTSTSQGELLLVPDLVGRVTLLDGKNEVIAHLGDDSERMKADAKHAIRGDEKQWIAGKFVHPHDACFDADGNIYVAEWVGSGRVSKLTKVS